MNRYFRYSKKTIVSLILLITLFLGYDVVCAATISSAKNGDWNSTDTWSGGVVPGVGDDVTIKSLVTLPKGITAEVNNLHIDKDGSLTILGELTVNGDLTMDNNGSVLNLQTGCRVVVKGNADLKNKVSLDISSYFIVFGNFSRTGSANQGDIVISTAHIYIFGTVDTPWTNFTSCGNTYSGTTDILEDPCDYGNIDALVTNDVAAVVPIVLIQKNNLTPLSACFCVGGNATLTIGETNSISLLKWYNGTTLLSTNTSPTSPYTYTATVAGSYSAIYKVGNQLYQTNPVTITTSPSIPATPGAITGAGTQCPGLTSQTYSIASVANANTYNWLVPAGWTITAGAGTNSVTVTTGSAGQNGDISVTAGNCCGVSAARTQAVTVSPGTPAVPTSNAGSGSACTQITANWSASANATRYFLDLSTVNTFASFVAGYNNLDVGNVLAYPINGLSAGTTYYYRVRASNSCGTSSSSGSVTYATAAVVGTPGAPTSSATTICQGSTNTAYTTSATNATSYNWSVTGTGNSISGTGTTGTVTWAAGFSGTSTVRVTANGCNGPSSSASTDVIVRPTPTATISGTTTVCQNATAPNVTFSNPLSLPVTITYNINGINQTTINVGANATATVAAPTTTSGSFEYRLVSVVYQTSPACSNSIINGSATINVMPLVHTNKITKL